MSWRPRLADVSGTPRDMTMPPSWSMATAGQHMVIPTDDAGRSARRYGGPDRRHACRPLTASPVPGDMMPPGDMTSQALIWQRRR